MQNNLADIKTQLFNLTKEINDKIMERNKLLESYHDSCSIPPILIPERKLNKNNFRELKTEKEILEYFAVGWVEAYQSRLKKLPAQLIKFPNPKTEFVNIQTYINHVGISPSIEKIQSSDSTQDPFWNNIWQGIQNLLENELIIGQKFIVKEIVIQKNTKIRDINTLIVKVDVYFTPSERARLIRNMEYMQEGGKIKT